jgi:hypothetical protein
VDESFCKTIGKNLGITAPAGSSSVGTQEMAEAIAFKVAP